MNDNNIILWEYQKKRVCEFYACSDRDDKQYPKCRGIAPKRCSLETIQSLLDLLNEFREKKK